MKTCIPLVVGVAALGVTYQANAGLYSDTVLDDNPVAYYQFEGNFNDSSAVDGNNNGTASSGGIPFGAAGTTFDSSLGQFADTNGSGFVTLGASNAASSLNADLNGASAVSIEFLVDIDSATGTGNRSLFFIPSGNSAGISVTLNQFENRLAFGGRSQNSDSFVSRFESVSGGVKHVVFTIDYATTTIQLYIDGELAAASVGSDSSNNSFDGGNTRTFGSNTYTVTSTNDELIGRAVADNTEFGGDFDELAIYSRVLTAEEIQSHFNAIPEPGSMALMGLGVACFMVRRRPQ
ncbi:MAG: LamG-like jellyroll fold domain-containing protein [Planctomycetota bacterium]